MRVTGYAGVGKSALVRHTLNYVQERSFMDGGCIYANGRALDEIPVFLKKLIDRIQYDSSGWLDHVKSQFVPESTIGGIDQLQRKRSMRSGDQSAEEIRFFKLLEFLSKTEMDFVFFFDNVDKLIQKSPQKHETHLMNFIERLLDKCPNAKVIITCRGFDNPSRQDYSLKLTGLIDPKQDSWHLFQEHYGRIV